MFYSMTGEQIPAPSSPRDGDDVPITAGRPRVCWFLENLYCLLWYASFVKEVVYS